MPNDNDQDDDPVEPAAANADPPAHENRVGRWARTLPGGMATLIGAVVTAAVALVVGLLTIFGPKSPPPNVVVPPPAPYAPSVVQLRLFESSDKDELQVQGAQSTAVSFDGDGAILKRGYSAGPIIGGGHFATASVPGTHLVWDNFCRDNVANCDGAVRTHYYKVDRTARSTLPGWRAPTELARFFDQLPDGSCATGQDLIYQFSSTTPKNTQIHVVGPQRPGPDWRISETLGCLLKP